MPIQYHKLFCRVDIQAHPEYLYVFGDNMTQYGNGGQARVCRGEPNAVGIPTKWLPSMVDRAFFTDTALDNSEVRQRIDAAFSRISDHLAQNGVVALPTAGVGTGLARLRERAPRVAEYIDNMFEELFVAHNITSSDIHPWILSRCD